MRRFVSMIFAVMICFGSAIAEQRNYLTHAPDDVKHLLEIKDQANDFFLVNTAYSGYKALVERDDWLDLSENMSWSNVKEELHPTLRMATMNESELVAVPLAVDLSMWCGITYSLKQLKNFGIDSTDIPCNLSELLTTVTQWYSEGTLYGVRLFDVDDQSMLINYILLAYTEQIAAEKHFVDYQSPFILDLMDSAEVLLQTMEVVECNDPSLPALFSFVSPFEYLENEFEDYGYTFLNLSPNHEPMVACYLTMAMVNPYSVQVELAIEDIAMLMDNMKPLQKLILFGDESVTVSEKAKNVYQAMKPYFKLTSDFESQMIEGQYISKQLLRYHSSEITIRELLTALDEAAKGLE